MTIAIEFEHAELHKAESFFKRTLTKQTDMAEAHLLLNHVLNLEKHHAESAHREIELRGREGVNLNVALLEAHVGELFGACAALGLLEHRG